MKQALPCGYSYCVGRARPRRSCGCKTSCPCRNFCRRRIGEQPDVEPHRRIERAVLVQAQPGQLVVKNLAVRLAEITVRNAPIRNRPGDAVDELAHGGFALGGVLFAVKIFRDDDLGGEHRPGLGHLDVFLLENDLAGVVGDFGGALVPFDLVERLDLGVAENALDAQRFLADRFGWFHGAAGGDFCWRRLTAFGAGAETSSRASIMVSPKFNFFDLIPGDHLATTRCGFKKILQKSYANDIPK
jgi:hypothetical protein